MLKLSSFISGGLFGIGLIASGMTNPEKVQSFLDVTGHWDPSLAFVMLGALMITSVAFYFIKKKTVTCTGQPLQIPNNKKIDTPLIVGSILFGIGWGLVGICPGPALANAGAGYLESIVFIIAMLIGMKAHYFLHIALRKNKL